MKIEGLYAIIDSSCVKLEEMPKVASELIAGGARVMQLRGKDLSGGEGLEAALAIKAAIGERDVAFIVNDRVDIALLSGADGVHLGQDDVPLSDARRLLGPKAIIGISTHNPDEAIEAEAGGADYISFGPVFRTSTKKDAQEPKGLEGLKAVRERVSLPIVAIGGIREEDLPRVMENGASGAAMISDVLSATSIAGKVVSIMEKLTNLK